MRALLFFILLFNGFYFIGASHALNKHDNIQQVAYSDGSNPQVPQDVQEVFKGPESDVQHIEAQAQPQPKPEPQAQSEQQVQTQDKQQESKPRSDKPEAGVVKRIFAPSFTADNDIKAKSNGKNNDENSVKPTKPDLSQARIIDIDQLQKIIDSFPEEDRRTIKAIKVQIATWPKEVFDEISSYREFVISARRIAKQKYTLLSPEAKSALETERQLKQKLSPATAKILEELEIKNN